MPWVLLPRHTEPEVDSLCAKRRILLTVFLRHTNETMRPAQFRQNNALSQIRPPFSDMIGPLLLASTRALNREWTKGD